MLKDEVCLCVWPKRASISLMCLVKCLMQWNVDLNDSLFLLYGVMDFSWNHLHEVTETQDWSDIYAYHKYSKLFFSLFHIIYNSILTLSLTLKVSGLHETSVSDLGSDLVLFFSHQRCSLVASAVVRKVIFHCPIALTPAIPCCLTPCCLATTSHYVPELTNQGSGKRTALMLCTR